MRRGEIVSTYYTLAPIITQQIVATLLEDRMPIMQMLKSLFCGGARPTWTAPQPRAEKKELFQRDGWGPNENFTPSSHYRGPLYPLPLRPKDAATLEASSVDLCNSARRAWRRGDMDEAASLYRAAANDDPANPDFVFEAGQLEWSRGRLDDAKALLEEAARLNPTWAPARLSLFRLNNARGDKGGAQEEYLKLIRCRPLAPGWVEVAATCLLSQEVAPLL